jgi:hypothetical protein
MGNNINIDMSTNIPNQDRKNISRLLKTIKTSPSLFPYELDIEKNKINFVKMDKAHYKKSFFILAPGKGPGHLKSDFSFSLNFDDIKNIFKDMLYENRSAIIYNHGFCCGTLLSRLIEESFNVLSLKEPPLVNTLKHYLDNNKNAEDVKNTIFCLHNRTFNTRQRVLWKPSDYAFDLIKHTELLSIPSIYLYSPLREYIASCSKEKRTQWIQNRADYRKILKEFNLSENNIDISKTANQAMLYWCYFAKKFKFYSSKKGNIIALNSVTLLNNHKITNKVGKHLKLNKKVNIFKQRNINKLLNTYSKTDDYEFNKNIRSDLLNKIIKNNKKDIINAELLAEEILEMNIRDFKFENEII